MLYNLAALKRCQLVGDSTLLAIQLATQLAQRVHSTCTSHEMSSLHINTYVLLSKVRVDRDRYYKLNNPLVCGKTKAQGRTYKLISIEQTREAIAIELHLRV